MSDKEVKNALAGESYHESWVHIYRGQEHERFFKYAFNLIDNYFRNTSDGRVLDAGCGTGNHIRHLTSRGYDVTGIDYSSVAIGRSHEHLDTISNGQNVRLQEADILNLPFDDETFSRVLCWGVLMHIPSVEKAIEELCRVTGPKGCIVIAELNKDSLQLKASHVIRKILRKKQRGNYKTTPAGVEAWDGEVNNNIVARKTDIAWLIKTFEKNGATLMGRHAAEFTELYAELNHPVLRHFVHFVNYLWYTFVRLAGPAVGNILIFKKTHTQLD